MEETVRRRSWALQNAEPQKYADTVADDSCLCICVSTSTYHSPELQVRLNFRYVLRDRQPCFFDE